MGRFRKIAQSEIYEKHQVEGENFGNKSCQQPVKSFSKSTFGIELPGKLRKRGFDTPADFENGTGNHSGVRLFRVTTFHGNQRYIAVFEQKVG